MKSTLFNFTSTATGGHVKGLADIFKFSSKFKETYIGTTQVLYKKEGKYTTKQYCVFLQYHGFKTQLVIFIPHKEMTENAMNKHNENYSQFLYILGKH